MDSDFSAFETALARMASQQDNEKTRHDKLVAKDEVQRARDLLKKETLTIEEVKETMILTTGNELKQLNTENDERIIFGKWQQRAEDHAGLVIEHLEQSRAFIGMEFDETSDNIPQEVWGAAAKKLNNGNPLTDDEKKEFIQAQAIRKITERKLLEEHRKNIDGFNYLNRSSLGIASAGLKFFATEKKDFTYNVPAEQVPKEHLK